MTKFIVEFWNSISFLIYHVVSLQVRWNAKKWCSFESMIRSELELCLHNWSLLKSRKNHFDPIMHIQLQVKRKGSISKRWCCHWCKFTKFTVFENHRKSLIQRLHFEWTKKSKSVARQLNFNKTKIGGKYQNWNETYWLIFEQCEIAQTSQLVTLQNELLWNIFSCCCYFCPRVKCTQNAYHRW